MKHVPNFTKIPFTLRFIPLTDHLPLSLSSARKRTLYFRLKRSFIDFGTFKSCFISLGGEKLGAALNRASSLPRLLSENVLYWISVGVFTPFLSAYLTRRGFSASEVGVMLTALPICSLIAQPIWSSLADKTIGRKATLVILAVASALTAPFIGLAASFASMYISLFLFSVFFQALLPICDSLVVEAASKEGVEFARIRMGGTIGYAAIVVVAGFVFESHPEVQFIVVSVALTLFAVQSTLLPQGWKKSSSCDSGSRFAGPQRGFNRLFDTDEIAFVLLLSFIGYVGLSFHGTYLGRWSVELGYGQELVGVLGAISAMSEVPILLLSDRLISLFGEIRLLEFSCIAMSIRLLLVSTGALWVMCAAQVLQSISYMTAYYSAVTYIARHALPGALARGQGLLALLQAGAATIVANFIGGWLSDAIGTGMSFVIFGVAVALGGLATTVAYRIATSQQSGK